MSERPPYKLTVDVLGDEVNAMVVQLRTRRFPSIVLQGDSLVILSRLATRIADRADTTDEELRENAEELCGLLAHYVAAYEAALDAHAIPSP